MIEQDINILEIAKETLITESNALYNQAKEIDKSFVDAINLILSSNEKKVVVTGMGKSGLIGRKISATFASTGTPSFFLHPGEAYHGDLGMVGLGDVIIAISYSGETDEILKIIPFFKENGNPIIAITGTINSNLALNAQVCLQLFMDKEACPLSLAPTTSTTLTLALGDAMAISLMKAKRFKEENFARFHPGGSLGRKLLSKVENKMRIDGLPIVSINSTLYEVINVISYGRLGIALVNEGRKTIGIITDGDLRRLMEAKAKDAWDIKAGDFMTRNPKTIALGTSLHETEELLNQLKITSLIVVNADGLTVGVVQIYDLH